LTFGRFWLIIDAMNIEEKSIEFLEWHIENSFTDLMAQHIIVDMEWDEGHTKGEQWIRAVARLGEAIEGEIVSNVICLFPPFFLNRPNNYYKNQQK